MTEDHRPDAGERAPDEDLPVLPPPRDGSVLWRVGGVVRTLRPHQWLKNSFVLAPLVFAKDMFSPPLVVSALSAFTVFCFLAGAVYTMNDIVDVEGDRVHPVKRFRPIPSGRVPVGAAKLIAAVLVFGSLTGAALIDRWFAATAAGYFALNAAYSFKLKKLAWIDVGCIAAGFVLRVVAGGQATHIKVSSYLLLCTALLALFLGFGKRRHELAQAEKKAKKQREALDAYTPRSLTVALALTSLATAGTYLAYTLDAHTQEFFKTTWLWPTTVHVLFGMFRFLQLVTGRPKAESPTQEMLRDVPFVLNLVVWVIEVVAIVYALRPSVG